MNELFESTKKKMSKALELLSSEYISIRAGRANPSILDKIVVDYYGVPTPINQVASISITEARVLIIQPWDASVIGAIEKAIQKSDMGINPQSDGKVVRVIFPQLTEDKRKEISKDISKMAEESRIAVRNIRRDILDKLKAMKKNSEITEDDLKHSEKKAQDLTDKFCSEIDLLCEKKTKQILEI